MTAEQVLALARDNAVEFVDLRFTTLLGRSLHVTLPLAEWTPERLAAGFRFGGASETGPRRLLPAFETAFIDPFCQHPTLAVICDVRDPANGQDAWDDPRAVARRTAAYLTSTKLADEARFAVDVQFFVFDQVCYEQTMNAARYQVDAREGVWRRGRDTADNLGTQLRAGEGASPLPPADSLHNLRSEMVAALAACGIPCSAHQHGPATGGQAQLSLGPAPLVRLADQLMTCKYVVRNVAARHGKVATFMPQPLFGEHGSGLPVRLSLWKNGQELLCGAAHSELSETGRHAVGGWLRHAASLLALTCPTTNSFRRLIPGFDAPTHLGYARDQRTALVNTPAAGDDPQRAGVEFRAADASSNPYLAFAALTLAALDGVAIHGDPGPSLDQCPAGSPAERLPAGLEDALAGLATDQAYLLKGDAFSGNLLRWWIDTKRHAELEELRARPHPYEFCMYFDI